MLQRLASRGGIQDLLIAIYITSKTSHLSVLRANHHGHQFGTVHRAVHFSSTNATAKQNSLIWHCDMAYHM
eukprot:6203886-Pleurochrysis_carterae.AAC.2